jgi:hypothetical protein
MGTFRIRICLLSHHICTKDQFRNMLLIRLQSATNVLKQIKSDTELMQESRLLLVVISFLAHLVMQEHQRTTVRL